MPDAECAGEGSTNPAENVSESRRGKRSAMRWRQRKPTRVRQFMRRLQLVCPVGSGDRFLQALAEPCIHRVFALSRVVHRVRERVLQFLRFQEITGGILYGRLRRMQTFLRLLCRILQTVSRWRIL